MAVLALAFAGVAVVYDGGAVDATVSSVSADISEMTVYLDKETTTADQFTVNITVTLDAAAGSGGEALTIASSTDAAYAITAPATTTIAEGETSGTFAYVVDPAAVTEAAGVNITFTCTDVATVKLVVLNPVVTLSSTKIIGYGGAPAATINAYVQGNAGQKFTLGYDAVAAAAGVVPYSAAAIAQITAGNDGIATGTFSIPAVADTLGFSTLVIKDTDNAGVTANLNIYSYATAATAKVIGYAEAANGLQAIYYDDATVLINLAPVELTKTTFVKVTTNYNGIADKVTVVGAMEQIWVDLAGQYAGTPANMEVKVESYDSDELEETAVNCVAYGADSVTFVAGVVGGYQAYFPGSVGPVTTQAMTAEMAATLVKNAIIESESAFTTPVTPTCTVGEFEGFSLVNDDTIAVSLIGLTTEEFMIIFGNGDASNNIYAVWTYEGYQIYLAGSEDTTATEQGTALINPATNKVDANGTVALNAVSVIQQNQDFIVMISQSADAKYTYTIDVKGITEGSGEIGTTLGLEPVMLSNGVYLISGVTDNAVVTVQVATGTLPAGLNLSIQSLNNTASGAGTAVAKLDVYDWAINDGDKLYMKGTYYRSEGEFRIFGNIENLGAGQVEFTATANNDNVAGSAIADQKLTLPVDAVTYSFKMAGSSAVGSEIGFYAVKAIYDPASGDNIETEYALATYA